MKWVRRIRDHGPVYPGDSHICAHDDNPFPPSEGLMAYEYSWYRFPAPYTGCQPGVVGGGALAASQVVGFRLAWAWQLSPGLGRWKAEPSRCGARGDGCSHSRGDPGRGPLYHPSTFELRTRSSGAFRLASALVPWEVMTPGALLDLATKRRPTNR